MRENPKRAAASAFAGITFTALVGGIASAIGEQAAALAAFVFIGIIASLHWLDFNKDDPE